jgi:Domain of unknown function (DUF4407)
MRQGIARFLFALAGVRPDILDKWRTDRVKFQSLGLAILITSAIATISMWFALNDALGLGAGVAVVGAVIWGLVIMGIDRWLVTSMPLTGGRRWAIALPRLVLALLLGSLISTPIVLRVFQSEINAQIVIIKQQQASKFIAQQEKSKVGQQVDFWTKDVSNLEKVIDSNGEVPLNPSADPVVISLTKQRANELKLEHQYYEQWQCQLYGGKGCTKKGDGPLAQASHKLYLEAIASANKLANQIQHRDKQLTANDQASRNRRLQQATSALPAAKEHLRIAMSQQQALQVKYEQENIQTNGLLIRLEALNQLSGKSITINLTRLLLFLLFLVIECLPVTVKLMQQPGNYEEIVKAIAAQELRDARRSLTGRPKITSQHESNGSTPVPATIAELQEFWRKPAAATKVSPDFEPMTVEERGSERPSNSGPGDFTDRANEELRHMGDPVLAADPDRRFDGTELHYDDDER